MQYKTHESDFTKPIKTYLINDETYQNTKVVEHKTHPTTKIYHHKTYQV